MDFISKFKGRFKRIEELQPSFDTEDMMGETEVDRAITRCARQYIRATKTEAYEEFAQALKLKFLNLFGCAADCWNLDKHIDDLLQELKEALPK